jgi:predicted TIM-barrel fold metal-dependent hydrolase
MVLGAAGDRHLNHPEVLPFFAAAEELDLAVAVHAGRPRPELGNLFETPYEQFVLPFVTSLFMGFVDIVAGGVLDRCPALRVAFLEAGCQWLPFLVDRADHYAGLALERRFTDYGAKEIPSAYLGRGNVFASTEVDDRMLPYVVERFGTELLLFASDIPHGDRDFHGARELRERGDLSEDAVRGILADNARRFYGARLEARLGGR